MNIDWVIPCRYVEVHDNLGTIIGAGIDTYWVPEFPAPIQVLLAVRLLAMAEEIEQGEKQKHAMTNRVRDPRGDVLSEMGGKFSVSAVATNPDWLTGIMAATAIQFEAAEEGTYTIDHLVDNASASLPIHVVEGLPPGVTPPDEA